VSTMLFPHPLPAHVAAAPETLALVCARSWTTRELLLAVQARAAVLADEGVQSGTTVALLAPRDDQWVIDAHAVGWLGGCLLPLDSAASQRRTAAILTEIRPDFAIQRPSGRIDRVLAAAAGTKLTSSPASLDEQGADAPQQTASDWPWQQARCRLLTSGTTGTARAVALTTGQWLTGAFASAIRLGHVPGDRWLCVLPLHHVGGLAVVLRCLVSGTTLELGSCFDAEATATRLLSGEITMVSFTPRMLAATLDSLAQRELPNSVRVILVGGGPMSGDLLDRCRRLQLPVARTWGMTEAASQVATAAPGDLDRDTIPPLPFALLRQHDGVLGVRGPAVGGVLKTADIGTVDATGSVRVDGRADDAIISGGAKIRPGDIEAVLIEQPTIADVAVVGRSHAQFGQRPVAFVVLQPAYNAIEIQQQDLERMWLGACAERLARYERPDAFYVCAALPRDKLGKLSRHTLRKQLEGLHALDEDGGHRHALEVGEVHEGVPQSHDAPLVAVFPDDPIRVCDRALAEPLDDRVDLQSVVQADGFGVAGLGMDQWHAEAERLEHRRVERGDQDFVKTVMRVLEGAREECDSGSIHVVEAGSSAMNEGHGVGLPEGT
jgi:o-succinylbenzoate---CoA ligase